MNMIFLLIVPLILLGCNSTSKYSYVDKVNEITNRKSAQICEEEKLKVVATGGAMMDSIHVLP